MKTETIEERTSVVNKTYVRSYKEYIDYIKGDYIDVHVSHDFSIKYNNGKCTAWVVGKM